MSVATQVLIDSLSNVIKTQTDIINDLRKEIDILKNITTDTNTNTSTSTSTSTSTNTNTNTNTNNALITTHPINTSNLYKRLNSNNIIKTKCNMSDSQKKYKKNDIIHYTGKYYNFSNFYAILEDVQKKRIKFSILNKKENGNFWEFYHTDKKIHEATCRPFILIQ